MDLRHFVQDWVCFQSRCGWEEGGERKRKGGREGVEEVEGEKPEGRWERGSMTEWNFYWPRLCWCNPPCAPRRRGQNHTTPRCVWSHSHSLHRWLELLGVEIKLLWLYLHLSNNTAAPPRQHSVHLCVQHGLDVSPVTDNGLTLTLKLTWVPK